MQARENPLSHDEPNLPDIRMSNPLELEEADPGFQDHPHLIFDSADIDSMPSNAFTYSDAFAYPISSQFRN